MKNAKVLIVDDDANFSELLADALEISGHATEIVHCGHDAIKAHRKGDFDITFMDMKMPGMNGVEAFAEIRKIKPDARVIIMTGYSIDALLQQAVDEGVTAILPKPQDYGEIGLLMHQILPHGLAMVVDDDPDAASSVKDVLEHRGFRVCVAHDGRSAVQIALKNTIDILILDLRLPLMNGLETYLEIKKHRPPPPTVIVTGYGDDEPDMLALLRSEKVTGCLHKPFHLQTLIDIVTQTLQET